MGIATAVIASNEDYQRVLKTPKAVFMLFVSQHCPACEEAVPLFMRIAGKYTETVESLVLDTAQTPRHPEVTGTPTLLIFQNGEMVEKLKGFGTWGTQEPTLEQTFSRYGRLPEKRGALPFFASKN
ncbi:MULTISPECIES: thioredoxin family protein [unclassified Pseudomonas]|uniref:thioredoxin family protein n=1 Tax=unclassified Pseudomonas TaxID=196821 RepID=UPI0011F05086|nr:MULTISPECIES: thioredoxin family protein [unclassified Pseudomonas]KAA0945830.1 thioredoxin family protein [Pseudomonas sp. ANT_H4]KAA0950811.1 thioredoxin family protein [Pseudomonas sp. ANT_H14]